MTLPVQSRLERDIALSTRTAKLRDISNGSLRRHRAERIGKWKESRQFMLSTPDLPQEP